MQLGQPRVPAAKRQGATRPSNQPLGGTSGDWRHRLIRYHLPLALASAIALFLSMNLPLFQAAGHQGQSQTTQLITQQATQVTSHQGSHQSQPQASSHAAGHQGQQAPSQPTEQATQQAIGTPTPS